MVHLHTGSEPVISAHSFTFHSPGPVPWIPWRHPRGTPMSKCKEFSPDRAACSSWCTLQRRRALFSMYQISMVVAYCIHSMSHLCTSLDLIHLSFFFFHFLIITHQYTNKPKIILYQYALLYVLTTVQYAQSPVPNNGLWQIIDLIFRPGVYHQLLCGRSINQAIVSIWTSNHLRGRPHLRTLPTTNKISEPNNELGWRAW